MNKPIKIIIIEETDGPVTQHHSCLTSKSGTLVFEICKLKQQTKKRSGQRGIFFFLKIDVRNIFQKID